MFDVLDINATAQELGTQPNDVYLLAQNCGILPAIRINSIDYYHRAHVEQMREFLNSRKEASRHVSS